jgi:class 3 adenylate cyclase
MGTLGEFKEGLTQTKYTGVPLNADFCVPVVKMYPSTVMLNRFVTSNPFIYSICTCFIFIFTSAVFLIYDSKVERRQKVVLTSAERTNAVVTSLFPSQVRDQILNDTNKQYDDIRDDVNKDFFGIKDVWNRRNASSDDMGSNETLSRPIADLYPETTVLFADIKGFTFWSASHTPIEVFTLLESLYNEFDTCARTRRVFKVETIGDCYVAVVGLPDPRKNHAVVMVRFADDILQKTDYVLRSLVSSLGDKTLDLTLRIGLNSGPTTAGVLRGEKSRFQLFGDTVNTAARMESNSMAGCIHCSQSTADLLVIADKEHWLIKRDEPVEAKGKGTMQTYWVQPSSDMPPSLSSSNTKGENDDTVDGKAGIENHLVLDDIDDISIGSEHDTLHSA